MLSDKQWEAQDNARTLARAEEIKADPAMLTAAKAAAGTMVKEEEERLKGLKKISGKKVKVEPEVAVGVYGNSLPGTNFGLGKIPGTW